MSAPPRLPQEFLGFPQELRARFAPLRRLGSGAMGTVFLVQDLVLGRSVALKFLQRPEDQDSRQRFHRESGQISSLNHPHVVRVFDQGILGETMFLVLEYLEGTSLVTPPPGLDPVDPSSTGWPRSRRGGP